MTARLRPILLSLALALVATATAFAAPDAAEPDLAAAARAAYDANDLAAARDAYLRLLDATPVPSAALHHDLANTYYRLADLPRAILHYNAALRRAPRDPDTAANLALALQAASVPPPPEPNAFLAPIRHLAPAEWTLLAIALYAVLALLLLAYLLLPAKIAFRDRLLRPVPALLVAGVIALACRLTFLLPSYAHQAIVDAPGAPLLSAPIADATELAHLPAGTTVILSAPAAAADAYIPVLLPPSTHGYIPSAAALPIP